MKVLTAALLATALIASPAIACPGMSAEANALRSLQTAAVKTPKVEEAMSTFDPADKPVFEAETVVDETVKKEDAVTE